MKIVPFEALTDEQRADAARVLLEAFVHMPSAWPTLPEAEAEVATFQTDEDRWAWAALDGDALVGWVGLIESYSHAFELHPLAVDPPRQRQGIGAALTAAVEAQARERGALTLYLGTDDDFGGTNLFGRDLFPEVAAKIAGLSATGGHPVAFYARQGYEVVGLIPDANGPGKPDIMLAKKLQA